MLLPNININKFFLQVLKTLAKLGRMASVEALLDAKSLEEEEPVSKDQIDPNDVVSLPVQLPQNLEDLLFWLNRESMFRKDSKSTKGLNMKTKEILPYLEGSLGILYSYLCIT